MLDRRERKDYKIRNVRRADISHKVRPGDPYFRPDLSN